MNFVDQLSKSRSHTVVTEFRSYSTTCKKGNRLNLNKMSFDRKVILLSLFIIVLQHLAHYDSELENFAKISALVFIVISYLVCDNFCKNWRDARSGEPRQVWALISLIYGIQCTGGWYDHPSPSCRMPMQNPLCAGSVWVASVTCANTCYLSHHGTCRRTQFDSTVDGARCIVGLAKLQQ